ncbi:16S rRNA (cytosine(1402)-N(4))-methyltransferase RsmH [Corynebacterium sp. CCM 8835]|uniref:Ribosomal RNA small subunit methyltransferase H n=1 Tax=Corynebacterium antarcticum TaxID=2800405 RepID=A0A9Q4GK00_9CORY|nr:16S rRNA (cytosine(1402)-N(4))-methyltransferase RsmH [Corynebacterium antarcticum]MCK7641805.1 16S rRNA (cytosine(1402)-N(4))-methyltransferase RsmH [Corynebacterium antarcticum]MCK7660099.1 16S rRNA (cytosine(1402)-N(4))-methyltransferase RsmH [Corynebacterium antarcticum]MCL0245034.1 16S rRNA (cytosine(1402)-N(4))-methyltransferase RsmH [Corynebacterium antarcticum]MCX7491408.1 16S rRNA (cytosine(1402)-N(4))-methyltransferase RsmH [Corynebacterium antarcticum]MCX7537427.1 16S rRNA (cytos
MTMTGNGTHGHVPVLRERVAELLRPAVTDAGDDAVIIDGTLGAGGHSEYLLTVFPRVRVIGLDRDPLALEQATERLKPFGDRFRGLHTRFDRFISAVGADDSEPCSIVREHGVSGALFDLGVSSMQLDQAERGFAYSQDAPLDMRMDPTSGITAADILNTYGHGELAHVLKTYGDERFAGKIASAVLREREKEPFTTSGRLVELLYSTIPAAARRTGGHPAKRTFQALRVEVNGELDSVAAMVPAITGELRVGGRAVFMAYQSLEDRIVKKALAEITTSRTPKGLPVDLPGTAPEFRLVTRGAEKAPQHEIEDNPRAAPVRVRAVERIAQSNGETR